MKKELSLNTIQQWLKNNDWPVRAAAMNACQGRDVPLDIIQQGLKDNDWPVRAAAMNACQGRDVPLDIIQQGLKDNDWRVRTAAMKWYKNAGLEVPLVRTIDPPAKVYKRCIGNVIVVAEIPDDAQVRGAVGRKCRADKAKIVDIIGLLGGEPVGISTYDIKTTYLIGDDVEINDFDYSDEVCSQGFHFFCTLEEARGY